jgi:hypothetical protein
LERLGDLVEHAHVVLSPMFIRRRDVARETGGDRSVA